MPFQIRIMAVDTERDVLRPDIFAEDKTVNICGLCLNQPETRRGFEVSKRRKPFLTERHLDAASPQRLGESMGHA
jgi:hypothetical protein